MVKHRPYSCGLQVIFDHILVNDSFTHTVVWSYKYMRYFCYRHNLWLMGFFKADNHLSAAEIYGSSLNACHVMQHETSTAAVQETSRGHTVYRVWGKAWKSISKATKAKQKTTMWWCLRQISHMQQNMKFCWNETVCSSIFAHFKVRSSDTKGRLVLCYLMFIGM